MKKTLLISALLFSTLVTFSQNIQFLKEIEFNDAEDYDKYEKEVLQCSNFLLNTKLDDNNENRLVAMQFIVKWMMGTPNYSFSMDETIGKVAETQESLIGIYMVCMTKFILENKDKADSEEEVKLHALKMLIKYSKDPISGIKPDEELKKIIEAEEKGILREYLAIG